jgi:hypothetical protein
LFFLWINWVYFVGKNAGRLESKRRAAVKQDQGAFGKISLEGRFLLLLLKREPGAATRLSSILGTGSVPDFLTW